MSSVILSLILAALVGQNIAKEQEVTRLVDTVESLLERVEDFRCEFEGTIHYRGRVAENEKARIDKNGLAQSFSGLFIRRKGGDTYCDTLNRMGAIGPVVQETLAIRMRESRAEFHSRSADAPIGTSIVNNPKSLNSWRPNCLGYILLFDKLKRDVADDQMTVSISDDEIDGRPLKVFDIGLKGIPDGLMFRYWIDPGRNGHVVRMESYGMGGRLAGRLDVTLAPFKIAGLEIWMPVRGTRVSYMAIDNKRPVVFEEPQIVETMSVVHNTMEFNRKPNHETFTLKYHSGTPKSSRFQKLRTEFAQQKARRKSANSASERSLRVQLARAEAQKTELVVAPVSNGFAWWSWTISGLGVFFLLSLIALWTQRHLRRY